MSRVLYQCICVYTCFADTIMPTEMASETASLFEKLSSSNLSVDLKEFLGLLVDVLQNSAVSSNKRVAELEDRVTTLEQEVQQLKNALDDNDQYERRDTIVLSGKSIPVEVDGVSCKSDVINCINSTLALDPPLIDRDINICHRVGKKKNTPDSPPRAIYIKMCRRDVIPEIYAKCRSKKPKDFYVSDSQTPLRAKISFFLRELKRLEPTKIMATVTARGDPVALVPLRPIPQRQMRSSGAPDGSSNRKLPTKRVTIKTKLELDYFVRDYFKSTLQELNLPWSRPRNNP